MWSLYRKMPLGTNNKPLWFYKADDEQILTDLHLQQMKEWDVVLFELFLAIGAHESGLLGEEIQMIFQTT